ncbi:SseB family protein [Thalassococcus sp. S3]|uniref:SseB family protein n=1 Tax=Thalassococcus sp. S3 TaxID=2017482 RepID=UPI001024615A|nr:SseB family protein [Thalassococcus sp. S3]QBF30971.1 hypothetical protein CFI11_07030 [Thalassococcus sp. S3]
MTETTPLDLAHAAMDATPDDETARLRFYERLADSELFLLLAEEAKGENIVPELFELSDGPFVLVFDREERLAAFVGRPAPYAALSGRAITAMLAGQGFGMGVNLEVAPSAMLVPPEAVAWLEQTLGHAPQAVEARISAFVPPGALPERLLTALDAKLATAGGLADLAYLVGTEFSDGTKGHLLGFVGALDGAEDALARAAGEALTFSGIEAGSIDVGFFAATDEASGRMAAVGLRFDLPAQVSEKPGRQEPPGSNPDRPPILR